MPRIPIASVQGQVGQGPGFTPTNVSPMQDPGGRQMAAQGEAIANIGEGAVRLAAGLQDQFDEGRVKEQLNKWDSATLRRSQEFRTKLGRDASKYEVAKALQDIEKDRDHAEKELDNPVQRELFRSNTDRRLLSVRESYYAHSTEQTRIYNAGQSKALSNSAAREAIAAGVAPPVDKEAAQIGQLNARMFGDAAQGQPSGKKPPPVAPGSPPRIGGDEASQVSNFDFAKNNAIEQRKAWAAAANGWGPDDPRTKEEVLQVTTEIHAGTVQGLVATRQTKRAKAYLDDLKAKGLEGEVDPSVLARLKDGVADATSADSGLATALEIADMLDAQASQGSEVQRDIADRTLAARGFEIAMSQFRAGKLEAKEALFAFESLKTMQAARVINQDAAAMQALTEAEKFLSEPANALLSPNSPQFPQELRQRLIRFGQLDTAAAFAEKKRHSTDWDLFIEGMEAAKTGAFNGMPEATFVRKYRPGLDDREWGLMLAAYTDANKRGSNELTTVMPTAARIDEWARDHSILSRDPRLEPKEKLSDAYGRLWTEVATAVSAFETHQLRGVRKATDEEVQGILDAMDRDRVFRGGEEVAFAALSLEERAESSVMVDRMKVDMKKIPPEVQRQIRRDLMAAGDIPRSIDVATLWVRANMPKTAGEMRTAAIKLQLQMRGARDDGKSDMEKIQAPPTMDQIMGGRK